MRHQLTMWLLLLLTCLVPHLALADMSIASFNIRHWGWKNDKNPTHLADILRRFDLIAVQEVMDDEAVEAMAERLERLTGDPWRSLSSDALGRSSYREHYSFLWRESAVAYEGGAVVYIDDRDTFAREPFSATFRDKDDGTRFSLANVHILWGENGTVADRLPEIRALADYWQWQHEIYPGMPHILAGDFNLPLDHPAWQNLTSQATPLIHEATTLSQTDGRYASSYDHFFVTPDALPITSAGVFPFPQVLGIDHETARDTVSDHVPVFLTLGNATVDTRISHPRHAASAPDGTCIDINRASAVRLADLPHIGEVRAKHIITGRPWNNVAELSQIRGIGPSRLSDIQNAPELCR